MDEPLDLRPIPLPGDTFRPVGSIAGLVGEDSWG